jgi:hypothetical protein
MTLPEDVTSFSLSFGPYTDAAGTPALAGVTGTITPSARLVDVTTGQQIVTKPVRVTIGAFGSTSVGPLPHTDNPTLSPTGFTYVVRWDVKSGAASPGDARISVPAAAGTEVDYDLLEPAEDVPGILVPIGTGPAGADGSAYPLATGDAGDVAIAALLVDEASDTRGAFDTVLAGVLDDSVAPIVEDAESATSVALRAAFGTDVGDPQRAELDAAYEAVATPESEGATADGTTADSDAFQALAAGEPGTIRLREVADFGGSTPSYVLTETVAMDSGKSIVGSGKRSQIAIPATGLAFSAATLFRLNTDAAHAPIEAYPGLPAAQMSNFAIEALPAAASNLIAFEFSGQYKFSELYAAGIDVLVKQSTDYCDLVTVSRVISWDKPETGNYLIDLTAGGGDGVLISQVHCGQTSSRTTRPRSITMKNKRGAAIESVINGDILIDTCESIDVRSLHMETGIVTFKQSSGSLRNGIFYMRNQGTQKVTPVVVQQGSGQTSVAGAVVSLSDLSFLYGPGLPGSYPTDGTANFSIDGTGTAGRMQVSVRNLFRNVMLDGSKKTMFGVSCGTAAFDAYSHVASLASEYRNGLWNITASLPALATSSPVLDAASTTSSVRTWGAAAGTYYYKAAVLLDSKRMIGKLDAAERSFTVTVGGSAPELLLAADYRVNAMFRIYRGTSTGSYSHYVDVPLISGGRLYDSGLDVGGYPWIARTAGAAGAVNTGIDAGLHLTAGETGAGSDAYGHAVAYARLAASPPTTGGWRRGDEVKLMLPVADATGLLLGWVRMTDCTAAAPAHVMGTDWRPVYGVI